MDVISDASGTYGCSAFSLRFQLEWPEIWFPVHITVKELLPIVIAAALWETSGSQMQVGNMAVADILKSRTSRDQLPMHLLRCLQHSIDLISYQSTCLVQSTPQLMQFPATMSHCSSLLQMPPNRPIPQPVLDLLVTKRPDWGSKDWMTAFASSLIGGLQNDTKSGWRQYASFCTKFGFSPLPLTEYTLCQFAANLADPVDWETIRLYLSTFRFAQISKGFPDPSFSSFPRLP